MEKNNDAYDSYDSYDSDSFSELEEISDYDPQEVLRLSTIDHCHQHCECPCECDDEFENINDNYMDVNQGKKIIYYEEPTKYRKILAHVVTSVMYILCFYAIYKLILDIKG